MKTATISVALMISVVLVTLLGAPGAGVCAQPGAERFVLTGLVVWSGKEGVAWLQEPDLTQNQIVTLRIGESVGPWKLTRFLENGVELEGPAGQVVIPLQGAGGPAVATGPPATAGPAPTARPLPRDDSSRVAPPSAPASPAPGYLREASRPAQNAGALGEALNKARAERAQRQAGNPQEQPRNAGPAGSQAAGGPGTPSGATSSDGASGAESGGTNQVIQLPVGGGKQGLRELFGSR